MTFSILRLLDLNFRFSGQQMEQSVQSFWVKGTGIAQEFETCSVSFSFGNLPICSERWYIQLQMADRFIWGNYVSNVRNTACNRECSGDFRRPVLRTRETPEAHTSRYTGCSTLPCMLPGCSCMPISILNFFSCVIPLLPVATTMPNGVLFSLFILKELTSRCCYSTMGLPGM